MRWSRWLMGLGCIGLVGVVGGSWSPVRRLTEHSLAVVTRRLSVRQRTWELAQRVTPIAPPVRGVHLAKTYHYRFAAKMPADARLVFESAIATYNRTRIVRLVPGRGTATENWVVFGIYRRQVGNLAQGQELGRGGPTIIQSQTPLKTSSVNHATATLNAAYPQAFNDAVAVHELGHALGLDHSPVDQSVMTPITGGTTQLSRADLAALQRIYQ